MNDRPDAAELLEAVGRFLREDVITSLEGPSRYQARVAANVLAIVARELESEERQLKGEWERLARVVGDPQPLPAGREAQRAGIRRWTEELVERIRSGEADQGPWRQDVLAHLEQTVADKLAVAKPDSR